jgi:glyoxylase-like metal-dependent hydrolase (beta-lactamase superfamily II)
MDGITAGSLRGRLVSHCLLIETNGSLVLVDTGYGLRDVWQPSARLSPFFLRLLRPDLREDMTAVRQIERLGYDAEDVRHIVLSHLDFDHAGGLDDFPHAVVHLLTDELNAALRRATALDRMRYRPQQWKTRTNWKPYSWKEGERWHGFSRVRELVGLPADIFMVPLVGHTLGHAGIAVQDSERGWLFYAGDAYFYHAEMDLDRPRCTPGLRMYQTMMEKNRRARLINQQRLRELCRSRPDLKVFCAHDVREFERLCSSAAPTQGAVNHAEPGALLNSHDRLPRMDAAESER